MFDNIKVIAPAVFSEVSIWLFKFLEIVSSIFIFSILGCNGFAYWDFWLRWKSVQRCSLSSKKQVTYIVVNKVNGKCIDQNVPNINKFTQLTDAAKGFFTDLMDHDSYNYRSICQYHSLLLLIFLSIMFSLNLAEAFLGRLIVIREGVWMGKISKRDFLVKEKRNSMQFITYSQFQMISIE